MTRQHGALKATCALLLAAIALSACADDDGGSDQERAQGGLGEASRATNVRPGELAPGADRLPDGTVEGEPSLDDLDPSAPPPGALGSAGTSCSGGDLKPEESNVGQVRRTTFCLLNVERGVRGIGRMRMNPRLSKAALAHAKDMVSKTYFAHDSRSGASFLDRIKRQGYLNGGSQWTVGENIAWGSGSRSTPREIVDGWMHSPPHRANILNRRFREIGIGIAIGAPVRGIGSSAATYNTDFGFTR